MQLLFCGAHSITQSLGLPLKSAYAASIMLYIIVFTWNLRWFGSSRQKGLFSGVTNVISSFIISVVAVNTVAILLSYTIIRVK